MLQVGVGMCMEGIEQNPVVYELMSEMAFRNQKVQLKVKSMRFAFLVVVGAKNCIKINAYYHLVNLMHYISS